MLPQDKDKLGEQLSAYLDGELNDSESAEVERRVAAEPEAREMLEALRRTVESVRALPHLAAPDHLLDELTDRMERAQLLNGMSDGAEPVRGGRRSRWRLVASAAIVVFAVGGGFWAFREMTDSISRTEQRVALVEENASDWAPAETPGAASRGVMPEARRRAGRGAKRGVIADSKEPVYGFPAERREARLGTEVESEGVVARDKGAVAPSKTDIEALRSLAYVGPQSTAEELGKKRTRAEVRRPIVAGAAAPVYPLEAPLEEKLHYGVDRRAVRGHRFANEAMQLDVSFASAHDRTRAQTQLNAFMLDNDIQPLEQAITDDTDAVPPSATFFVEGRAHLNFGESADGVQVLARLGAPELDALVEGMRASSDLRMQLAVGDIVAASNADRVREVLRTSFARQFARHDGPTEYRFGSAADSTGAGGTFRRRGRAMPRSALKAMDTLRPTKAGESAESSRDRDRAGRKSDAPANGRPRAQTDSEEPIDASSGDLTGPPEDRKEPAPDSGDATKSLAADDVITVVISLRTPPAEAKADAPAAPPTTQPVTTQPATHSPATSRPMTRGEPTRSSE